ncbi:inositol-pentakisphosphate 2-kinase [Drosophila gunungcola]|uniref:inositol-pentakisphosphate 2-kinase n=1 Tax=Drosophila gunungcola TaxID=103775 RepID=UPI0022E09076|nr:inositol-pentakisphosphate 2-kinase [Drosophila gunungcola]XP_052842214.1 inositol-pentakisphosphate 2-kinase [Drosophila gunungcola]XP_052842215.1 inositol-pentakisphosphate 2-kinase [Drosophila gunungcola]
MTAARAPQAPPGVGQKLKLKPQFRFQFQFQPHRPAKNLHALLDLPAAMELRQIELIYRAEGNANLVLALPQFKKVLRLPKMISSGRRQEERDEQDEQDEVAGPEGQGDSSGGAGAEKAGDLTMPDFMAYIGIMRRLLGNEFVCGADIVAIPKEDDRLWINEHIRAQRPISRLDKEFVGPFGLLLPDVTQLPATFDVLLANLQAKGTTGDGTRSGVRRLGDTYAIEIKPKQGWLQLASDVNDLFDLMPAGEETKRKEEPRSQEKRDEKEELGHRDKCWCRFCSMQLLKLHNGKIKRLGHYCPLDLFSGAPSRMFDALDALLACPQNNLRVFQNGNLIYGDHANSISFDELHSLVFPGEIMVLIKHLLVACLLREYEDPESNRPKSPNQDQKQEQQQLNQSRVSIAATETKAVAAGIGAANVVLPLGGRVAAPVVTAGQSSTRTRAAAATATTQRYTKMARMETTVAGATLRSQLATATRTEKKPETETLATPSTSRNENQNESRIRNENENENEGEPANQTQAQINKAEIFRLPNNCVLQKILNLQLLVKRHFDFMWHSGYAGHCQPTYNSLRGLLTSIEERKEQKVAEFEPDEEQAYMLGATALDCSIMLTFQEIEIDCETDCPAGQSAAPLQPWCVSLPGHHFLTKLTVLDLDPKPDSHFHKFIVQTREIEKCRRALN